MKGIGKACERNERGRCMYEWITEIKESGEDRKGCVFLRYTCGSHCATSRKVAGSIPDNVIGIFH
jgi:hypothetical protein